MCDFYYLSFNTAILRLAHRKQLKAKYWTLNLKYPVTLRALQYYFVVTHKKASIFYTIVPHLQICFSRKSNCNVILISLLLYGGKQTTSYIT
jgi:hypothetical protein